MACTARILLLWVASLAFACTALTASESPVVIPRKLRAKGLHRQAAKECKKRLGRADLSESSRKALLLELAACYQFDSRENRSDMAAKIYREFIKKYPDDALTPKAYFNLARCLEFVGKERAAHLKEAQTAYRTVYEKFPKSIWADQAFFWLAQSHIRELNPQNAAKAVKLFKAFLQRFPDSMLRGIAASQISELACSYLGNPDMAITYSLQALKYGLYSQNLLRKHYYRLGYLYQFVKKDLPNALIWYQKLLDNSPTKSDPNYFLAKKRVAMITKSLQEKK